MDDAQRIKAIAARLDALPAGTYTVWRPEGNYLWRSIGISDPDDPERSNQVAEVSVAKFQRTGYVEDRSHLPDFYAAAPDDMRFLLAANARLAAALQSIGELGDVDCDEAPELARRALKADTVTEHQE